MVVPAGMRSSCMSAATAVRSSWSRVWKKGTLFSNSGSAGILLINLLGGGPEAALRGGGPALQLFLELRVHGEARPLGLLDRLPGLREAPGHHVDDGQVVVGLAIVGAALQRVPVLLLRFLHVALAEPGPGQREGDLGGGLGVALAQALRLLQGP